MIHIQFGGEVGKRVNTFIINLFAIGFVLLIWSLAAYIIDLIVQSA